MPSHWLQQTVPELLASYHQAGQAVHAFFLVKIFKNDKNGHKLVMFKDEDDKLDLPGFHAYLSGDGKKTSSNSSVQALAIEMLKEPLVSNTVGNLQFADLLDPTPLVINDAIDETDRIPTRNMTISMTLFGDINTDARDWRLSRLLDDTSSPQDYAIYEPAQSFSLAPLKAFMSERRTPTRFIERLYSRRAYLTKSAFLARNKHDVRETQALLFNMATTALAVKLAVCEEDFREAGTGFFGVKVDGNPCPKVTVFCFDDDKSDVEKFDRMFGDDVKIGSATYTNLMTFSWKAGKCTSFDVRAAVECFALDTLIDRDGRMVVEWNKLVVKERAEEEPEEENEDDEDDEDELQLFLRKIEEQLKKHDAGQ